MITLAIINFLLGLANSFIMNYFSNLIQPLTSLGSYIVALSVYIRTFTVFIDFTI